MHECWSNSHSTVRKAFLEHLCHLFWKGGRPGESWLHYNMVGPLRAMKMLQTRVQRMRDTSWMSQCSRIPRSSWFGTGPGPWPWRPVGGRNWPGSLRLQTGTPADRSEAGPAWRSPPSASRPGIWAQRTPVAGGAEDKHMCYAPGFGKSLSRCVISLTG